MPNPNPNSPLAPGPEITDPDHIPLRTLGSDPRISYALYIPPRPHNTPSSSESPLPLLVYVHGIRRDISPVRTHLSQFADSVVPCAILAPLFPADNHLYSYKDLRSETGMMRSDLALLSIIDDEIAPRYGGPSGIATRRIFLVGFSAGAQFAHRFLYLHPSRVAAASVAAPGSVTQLDDSVAWPRGVADVSALFGTGDGVGVDVEQIRKVPVQLVVGSRDNKPRGGGREYMNRDSSLERERSGKKAQGGGGSGAGEGEDDDDAIGRGTGTGTGKRRGGRRDVLEGLDKAWREKGITAKFDVVEGVGHSFAGVCECILQFMRPLLEEGEPGV